MPLRAIERKRARVLARLKKPHQQGLAPAGSVAILYGALGKLSDAFARLEKTYQERYPELTYLKMPGRGFELLRRDPLFKQSVQRIELPE